MDALQRHRADVVYVLNSTPSDANPSSIASLAGVPAEKLIYLSEAQGCLNDSRAARPMVQQDGNAVHIVSVLPGCATYEFNGVPLSTIAQAFGGGLSRGHFATYSLPEGRVTEYGSVDKSAIASINPGEKLDLNLCQRKRSRTSFFTMTGSTGNSLVQGRIARKIKAAQLQVRCEG